MYEQVQLVNFLAFFCFFNYIFYKGLSQPEIFSGIIEKPKYETSRLTAIEGEQYLAKLEAHMRQNKPYLDPTLVTPGHCGDPQAPVKVEPGHVFVMGDNRAESLDSRAPAVGQIAFDNLIGRAVVVIWPKADWRWL